MNSLINKARDVLFLLPACFLLFFQNIFNLDPAWEERALVYWVYESQIYPGLHADIGWFN